MGVDEATIEAALERAEAAVRGGSGLRGTGFWQAVAAVKRDPDLVERHADRIGAVDEAAFRRWALLTVPLGVGTSLMVVAAAVGLALIGAAYRLDGLWAVIAFFVGLGALLVTTHGLGHVVVGSIFGIRFLCWFVGPISFPLTGGVKIDYRSYLRTPAERRAWMHAAGALTTKLVPVALIGAAIAADLEVWAIWLLAAIAAAAIVTDVVWSTTKSDWKRFRREMCFVAPDRPSAD